MLLTIRDGTFMLNDNGFKVVTQDSHLVSDYLAKKTRRIFQVINFQKILIDELARQNLTHSQLGAMSGLTGRAISYYVKGERTPNIYDAEAVITALGIKIILGE